HLLLHNAPGATYDFGLIPSQSPDKKTFTFVQTTDIHVGGPDDIQRLCAGIAEINDLVDPPQFVLATGDLVNKATYRSQLDTYTSGVKTSRYPWFSVFGNHDRCDEVDKALYYNEYLGPDYYAFAYGDYFFVMLNIIMPSDEQTAWMKQVIEKFGANKRLLVFQHYPPKLEQMQELSQYNVAAVFTGHWHSNKINTYEKTLAVNTPTFIMGGIDGSPSGFRIVKVDGEKISSEYRFGGVDKRIVITEPQESAPVGAEPVTLRANIYDSNAPVTSARYELEKDEKPLADGQLRPEGPITWRSSDPVAGLNSGSYGLQVTAQNGAGERWSEKGRFSVVTTLNSLKQDLYEKSFRWPMFMGGPTHEGTTTSSFTLPLRLVWSAFAGGPLDLGSPVVGDGKIYLGVKDRDSLDNNGLLCLDLQTGQRQWLYRTDSAVNHSPVLSGPYAIVVSMTGKVTAVDAATGHAVWTYTLGDGYSRWIYSAPAVSGEVLYAGSTKYLAALEAATGKELWTFKEGADWISSYSSPAVDNERVYIGSNWNDNGRKSANLVAIDKATGRRVWDAPIEGMHGSPTLKDGRLYATDIGGNFYEYDSKTGEQLWKFPMESGWSMSTPAISGDVVVAASGQGTIFALNPRQARVDLEGLLRRFVVPHVAVSPGFSATGRIAAHHAGSGLHRKRRRDAART
ncbi:MAG: PQQ-binding-like beta-propeller repeat protein, partial [bacterium]